MSDENRDMSDREFKVMEELVNNLRKLNDSLIQVSDAVCDVRASMNRMLKVVEG